MPNDHLIPGCILPTFQALIVMVLVLFLASCAFALLGWETDRAILAGCVAGAAAAIYVWIDQVRTWRRDAYPVEVVAPPTVIERPASTVHIVLHDENDDLKLLNLPCSERQLQALARGIVDGKSLSESNWIGIGRPFTRAQFVDLREELIRRGWLAWISQSANARGVAPTRAGRAAFRHLSRGDK
jgi:hypothetical protein